MGKLIKKRDSICYVERDNLLKKNLNIFGSLSKDHLEWVVMDMSSRTFVFTSDSNLECKKWINSHKEVQQIKVPSKKESAQTIKAEEKKSANELVNNSEVFDETYFEKKTDLKSPIKESINKVIRELEHSKQKVKKNNEKLFSSSEYNKGLKERFIGNLKKIKYLFYIPITYLLWVIVLSIINPIYPDNNTFQELISMYNYNLALELIMMASVVSAGVIYMFFNIQKQITQLLFNVFVGWLFLTTFTLVTNIPFLSDLVIYLFYY